MAQIRKTYFCVCEGQQEEMYLKHVAKLVKDFPQKVLTFDTTIDSPKILEKTYKESDSAALFDFDFKEANFINNIEICDKLNEKYKSKRSGNRNIYHAFSNVNFDLWLVLHKEDCNKVVFNNDAYVNDVRRVYYLQKTEDIKREETIKKILSQITLDDVKIAINRAEKIRNRKLEDDAKKIGKSLWYDNPDFSIHSFLEIALKGFI